LEKVVVVGEEDDSVVLEVLEVREAREVHGSVFLDAARTHS
jgi:hypothetical protein